MADPASRSQVAHTLSVRERQRLTRAGFTVGNYTITGTGTAGTANPKGTFFKALYGGIGKWRRLRQRGITTI